MNQQICKYSIIRFQPYPETEEFANIGIVLYATTSKRLEFRVLDNKNYGRITHFFDDLCKEAFVETKKIIVAELERIQYQRDDSLYNELIRPREDIIRFSENRVLFSTDPAETVDKLFEHYVHRSFLKTPNYEDNMKRQVRDLLSRYDLSDKYKDAHVGSMDKYEVHFPFVHQAEKQAVIKPLHFKYEKPSQLINHGISWLGKIQQLERFGFIAPDDVLFAYNAPDENQETLLAAFNSIKEQIEGEGILMIDIHQHDEIIQFAATRH